MANQRFVGLAAVFLLLALSLPGSAQTTGSIRGDAVDSTGGLLAGVTVTLAGDPLPGGERIAATGSGGAYLFSALPVGRYTVTASLQGFRTQRVEDVRVSVNAVATVNFTMDVAQIAEEVTVTAVSPLVDVASSTVGHNYDEEFVEDLPTRRNFWDIVALSPGVFQPSEDPLSSFRISSFGANVQSGAFNVDGVNMTAPEGGYLFFNLNPDVIVETQMIGLSATAEYGSTAGAVFNVVTKSGGNEFHGSAALLWGHDNLTGTNVTLDGTDPPANEFHTNKFYDASLTLGGPIIRDKFWFFGAYQNTPENITPPGEDPRLTDDTTRERYDLKLSARLSEGHRVEMKFGREDSYRPWGYDPNLRAPSSWNYRTLNNDIFSGGYTGTLSDNTLLQVRGGVWRGDNGDLPVNPTEEIQFVDFQASPVTTSGGTYWDWIWEQHHDQADVVVTHYAEDFLEGHHEFKFGVQYNQGGGTTTTYNTTYQYLWPGGYYPYRWEVNPYQYGGNTTSISGFATDSWTVSDRLTLNLGVRYDNHDAKIPDLERLDVDSNPTGETIPGVDMFQWKTWSPRLGFALQPTADGRTVVRGSVGLYYDGTVSGNWYAPPPERPPWNYYWIDPDGVEHLWQSIPASENLLQSDIANPKTWEYTVGMERQVGTDIAVGAQFVYKKTSDQVGWQILGDGVYEPFQWTDPDTGQTFDLVDIIEEPTRQKGNSTGPGAVGGDRNYTQDYRGFFVTFKKRYSDGWDLVASYTLSKAEGLTTRPFVDPQWGQGSAFWSNSTEAHPNVWGNAEGLLAGDRKHAFRLSGNVDLPWEFRLGAALNFQSGRPAKVSRRVTSPTDLKLQMISIPNSNDTRLSSQALLDLNLGKRFELSDRVSFNLDLQFLNLLNDDAVTYYHQEMGSGRHVLAPGEEFDPGKWLYPRRMRIRAKLSF